MLYLIQTLGTVLRGNDMVSAVEKEFFYQNPDLVIIVYDDQHLSARPAVPTPGLDKVQCGNENCTRFMVNMDWVCTSPISPYGNLDASVAKLRDAPRRRYQGVVRSVIPSLDDVARNARCFQGGAYALSASERQFQVKGVRSCCVSVTDDADIGIGGSFCRSDRGPVVL